jgi:hypothetical protein
LIEYQYNIGMILTNMRRGLGFLILLVGLVSLVWGLWPAKRIERLIEIPWRGFYPTASKPTDENQVGLLKLAWPAWMQLGSTGAIRVELVPGNKATQELARGTGAAIVPGLSSEITDQRWVIEARLEIPGIPEPVGAIREAFTASAPLVFTWKVQPLHSGSYSGDIWLHLVELPTSSSSAEQRRLLSIQPVEIRVTSLFSLNTYLAQVIGIVGCVLGLALVIDILYPRIRARV